MTFAVLLVVVLLIVVNGFFVAVEFALLASRAARLEPMTEGGDDAGASAALEAVQDLQPQLVGAQLGITMASLGLGYVGEPAVASLIERAIGVFVELPSGVLHTVSFIVALSIVVLAHMVVGEMVAKNLALANPERVARALAPIHAIYLLIFKPLIWSLNAVSNAFVRLLGTQPVDEINTALTVNEFHTLFEGVKEEGKIEHAEHALLAGALNFADRTAGSIMVPMSDVVSVPRATSIRELESVVATSGHSRIPIQGSSANNIVGFVHSKDLLRISGNGGDGDGDGVGRVGDGGGGGDGAGRKGATGGRKGDGGWQLEPLPLEVIRRMLIVDPNRSVRDLMVLMRSRRCHVALVQARDGRLLGMVTLEDVLESLVGEIRDETDPAHHP